MKRYKATLTLNFTEDDTFIAAPDDEEVTAEQAVSFVMAEMPLLGSVTLEGIEEITDES